MFSEARLLDCHGVAGALRATCRASDVRDRFASQLASSGDSSLNGSAWSLQEAAPFEMAHDAF
jgi:hypothetical protein